MSSSKNATPGPTSSAKNVLALLVGPGVAEVELFYSRANEQRQKRFGAARWPWSSSFSTMNFQNSNQSYLQNDQS